MNYFVTGIHTDAGKTVASAYLQLALDADYWKPVQAGDLDFGDTDRVRAYTGLPSGRYHPVRHALRTPASPHYAARLDGVDIRLEDFTLPTTDRPLLVEGAGGLLVPLNEEHTIADLVAHLNLPVILVSRHYLGSINHTLLSVETIRRRGLELAGIVYSGGAEGAETVSIVRRMTGAPLIAELPEWSTIDAAALSSAPQPRELQ